MKVDYSFPPTPNVSVDAKNLIRLVSSFCEHFHLNLQRKNNTLGINFDVFVMHKLLQILVKDPSKRLPLTKILEHPWIIKNADPSGTCSE